MVEWIDLEFNNMNDKLLIIKWGWN